MKTLVEGNFVRIRQQLQTAKPPCLPYIGMFLSDLTFAEGSIETLYLFIFKEMIFN
jgi:hypothetical protein